MHCLPRPTSNSPLDVLCHRSRGVWPYCCPAQCCFCPCESSCCPACLQGTTAASRAAAAVSQHPEFLLPYLLYLLGHHPDMPKVRVGFCLGEENRGEGWGPRMHSQTEKDTRMHHVLSMATFRPLLTTHTFHTVHPIHCIHLPRPTCLYVGPSADVPPDPSALQAFCRMLQLALEALLVGTSAPLLVSVQTLGSGDLGSGGGCASLALMLKVLHSIKEGDIISKVSQLAGAVGADYDAEWELFPPPLIPDLTSRPSAGECRHGQSPCALRPGRRCCSAGHAAHPASHWAARHPQRAGLGLHVLSQAAQHAVRQPAAR